MSVYPDKFPYKIRSTTLAIGWKHNCVHCQTGVEYPKVFVAYIDENHSYHITDHKRDPVPLCGKKCAAEYWWKEFCVRRLRGEWK